MLQSQAGDFNQDGSITIEIDGQKIKFVKDSDLQAVKGGAKEVETERDSLRTQLATANSKYDSEHQSLLQLRTSHAELEKQVASNATTQEQLNALTSERDSLKESVTSYETKLTDRLKGILTTGYNVGTEKLEGKTLADLENMESVLTETGHNPKPANYDGAGVPGGGTGSNKPFANPLQGAIAAYESSNKQ